MTSASSFAPRMAARTRSSRASSTASGNSTGRTGDQAAAHRFSSFCYAATSNNWRGVLHNTSAPRLGHQDGIAEHDVAGLRMIGVGMHDQASCRVRARYSRLPECAAWNRRTCPCRGRARASIGWWCIRRDRACGTRRSRLAPRRRRARPGRTAAMPASSASTNTAKARRCASFALPTTSVRQIWAK